MTDKIVWTREAYGDSPMMRARLIGDDGVPERWALAIEQGEDLSDGDECGEANDDVFWSEGSVTPETLFPIMIEVSRFLRDKRTQLSAPVIGGSESIPSHSVSAVATGAHDGQPWAVTLKAVDSDTRGRPLLTLTTSHPLTPDEWIVVGRSIARAVDAWQEEFGL